jgi:putative resolvase
LERQIQYLSTQYPNHEIIKDIGSGINFKRPGLRKLIRIDVSGELEELVLTYKDRLCRIGFDMLEFIFNEYSDTRIIIENEENQNQQEKITEDLIRIITVYSSKLYGSRSSKNPKIS